MKTVITSSPGAGEAAATPTTARAYSASGPTAALRPQSLQRRALGSRDVQLDILYCGVCHSDLHQVRNEWQNTVYPCVPGHEIVGRITAVGNDVTRFAVGQLAAVGCMVGSCGHCPNCRDGLEQYCDNELILTYNSPDPHAPGSVTLGGYSERIVVDQDFTLRVPEGLDLAATAPLLCAGITAYSPLRHWQVGPGKTVGIVGLGGLGHMGVKFAHAMGAHVVLFTTSPGKVADGRRLGADEVVVTTNADELTKRVRTFDFVLDAVSAKHDVNAYLNLLKRDGTLCLIGAPEEPLPIAPFSVIFGRRSFAGSGIGGIKETQEMLDFCGKHRITSDIEMIDIQQINQAYERLLKGDVKFRFVIDMSSIRRDA